MKKFLVVCTISLVLFRTRSFNFHKWIVEKYSGITFQIWKQAVDFWKNWRFRNRTFNDSASTLLVGSQSNWILSREPFLSLLATWIGLAYTFRHVSCSHYVAKGKSRTTSIGNIATIVDQPCIKRQSWYDNCVINKMGSWYFLQVAMSPRIKFL